MKDKIKQLCKALLNEVSLIPADRKKELKKLSGYIANLRYNEKEIHLTVICTHNSRRSHMGQIWLTVAADYFKVPRVYTYSGGTEATAFNKNAVQSFVDLGFGVQAMNQKSENPKYQVQWEHSKKSYTAFSKKYDETPNPTKDFAAIMVCDSANEACPFVKGSEFRIALTFEDPKKYDNTPQEKQKYKERNLQIGREMLYVMQQAVE